MPFGQLMIAPVEGSRFWRHTVTSDRGDDV